VVSPDEIDRVAAMGAARHEELTMTTAAATITNKQIRALKAEAATAGDLAQVMICDLAIGGPAALTGAEPGTEADRLLSTGMSQDEAREACADVIADAEAQG